MEPNLSYILKLADGSKAFEEKMIRILKSEFPIEKTQYLTAIQQQDFFQASEIVHKIKHKLGMLSMDNAYQKAILFEEALKVSDSSNHSDFLTILDIVENYISSI